ncbi:MAG: radical SAM protein [Candidatus Electrothrix sp. GM3_4]|nr:radical SAM protein [Candidatus Electrothrix sp. GM3_4]
MENSIINKKFLFVYIAIEGGYVGYHHGIASLVPVIRRHSYDVSVLTLDSEISSEEFRKHIEQVNPSIVGFSCTLPQYKFLKKYSSAIEDLADIIQIAGGVLPTLEPQNVLETTSLNGVVVGEGEKPIDNLLDQINKGEDIYNIKGIYWNINGKIKKNSIPQFISDLSEKDFPDPTVFDDPLVCTPRGELKIMLSRGCPYECHYCSNYALKRVYPSTKGYLRIPSVEYSIKLIKKMLQYYPQVINIIFEDDLLIADKKWFKAFAEEYQKEINVPYRLMVRPEAISTEIAKLLKDSGCYFTQIGLESGSESLRGNLLNRKYSNKLFIEKCKILKDNDLLINTFNIVGWPFETKAEMQETLELNRIIESDMGVCTFFYPFKGTELYNICTRENLLKSEEEMECSYHIGPNIKLINVTKEECVEMQRKIMCFLTGGTNLKNLNLSYSHVFNRQ